MKGVWYSIYFFKGIWIGLKGIRRIQLGSRVKHDGQWWFVSNWAGQPFMTLAQGNRKGSKLPYKEYVPKEKIQPSLSPLELWHRFNFMRRWYMTNWFSIDINKHLYLNDRN